MSIKIVTDSTADLSQEVIDRYGITVIPMQYTLDGITYTDRVDITPAEFIEKMKGTKELPKTSQPSLGIFLKTFNELTADGSEVLAILVAGTLSGTLQTARLAAREVKGKVTIVDSLFISKALGFQVIEAAKMAAEGKSVEEITDRLEKIRSQTKLYVVLDTLENLVKGGRIGRGKGLISSLLNIKPIAAVQNGLYTPIVIARSYRQAIKQLANMFNKDIAGKRIGKISLVHADGLEMAERLKQKIRETTQSIDIPITETTPAIITHTGPGAIGLMFYTE